MQECNEQTWLDFLLPFTMHKHIDTIEHKKSLQTTWHLFQLVNKKEDSYVDEKE